jgi:hypothetical protein
MVKTSTAAKAERETFGMAELTKEATNSNSDWKVDKQCLPYQHRAKDRSNIGLQLGTGTTCTLQRAEEAL